MTRTQSCLAALALVCFSGTSREASALPQNPPAAEQSSQLRVFLDCQGCFSDFLRADVTFVDYVRDREQSDVHVLITSAETGGGGREHTIALIGQQASAGTDRTLRTMTVLADSEDVIRRQLANSLRVGLLNYVARETVPADLAISVRRQSSNRAATPLGDRWNSWVFSLSGSASVEGEESSRQTQLGGSVSADRITPTWKVTFGAEVDHESEEFDLDEDDPVKVNRRERDFRWLVVRSLGEHWSVGGTGEVESSTFENIKLLAAASPAIEYNVFPYSMYTRRQLRALYSIGVRRQQYHEVTLFGKLEETLPRHELSLTLEQREPWGSIEAGASWSQYLHERDKTRLEVGADVSLRVARGLSVGVELSASRIRDQLALPARGASPEEVLLEQRELRSGYEFNVGFNVEYSFGSIFSSVVNPRFGN